MLHLTLSPPFFTDPNRTDIFLARFFRRIFLGLLTLCQVFCRLSTIFHNFRSRKCLPNSWLMARVCVANCNFGYLLQNAATVKKIVSRERGRERERERMREGKATIAQGALSIERALSTSSGGTFTALPFPFPPIQKKKASIKII